MYVLYQQQGGAVKKIIIVTISLKRRRWMWWVGHSQMHPMSGDRRPGETKESLSRVFGSFLPCRDASQSQDLGFLPDNPAYNLRATGTVWHSTHRTNRMFCLTLKLAWKIGVESPTHPSGIGWLQAKHKNQTSVMIYSALAAQLQRALSAN